MKNKDKILNILADALDVNVSDLSDDKRLREDLKADSLKEIKAFMAIEDSFDIEIEEEDALAIKTVGDVIEILQKYF